MGSLADIMGVPINVLSDRELLGLMRLYMGNDYMNRIFMLSVDTFSFLSENPEQKSVMDDADLIIPAEKIVLGKRQRHFAKNIVKGYMSFMYLLRIKGLVESMYIIGDGEKQTEQLVEVCKKQNDSLIISGSCNINDETKSEEEVINEINSVMPDIIILAVEDGKLFNWVMENGQKLAAKLCVCMCDIAERVIKENSSPPGIISALGFEKLYYSMIQKKYKGNTKKERIFNALIADYNNKNGE